MSQGKIHQRRKIVATSKQEILLLNLPEAGREMYNRSTQKQLRDRLSTKFGKLMAADIDSTKDGEIREEIKRIKRLETRNIPSAPQAPAHVGGRSDRRDKIVEQMSDDSEGSEKTEVGHPVLDSSMERNEDPQPGPSAATGHGPHDDRQHRRARKRSLAEIIRSNQLAYEEFIKKKVPKILRELGISSDSSEDST